MSFGPSVRIFQILNGLAVALLIGAPVAHWLRERRRVEGLNEEDRAAWRSSVYEGPGDTAIAVSLVAALACQILLLASPSRWPVALAFAITFALTQLILSPSRPVRTLFVAIAATVSLWPVDDHVTSRVENRLSVYLARLASDRLDSNSILNVPQGRIIRTLGGQVEVGLEDGRLPGLRLGGILGAALALAMRRSTMHVMLMTVSGWFWAAALLGFHYYGLAARQNSGGFVEGLWGYPVFVMLIGAVLLLSTDQLWLVLGIFNPFSWFGRDRKRVRKQESAAAEPEEPVDDEPEPRVLPGVVFLGIGVAAAIVAFLDIAQTLQYQRRNGRLDEAWKSLAKSEDRGFMPARIGRWTKADQKPLMDTLAPSRDASIVSTRYVAGDQSARVAFVGTYETWYDRYQDFRLKGWREGIQRVVNDPTRNLSYVVNELSLPTGEHCTLIYEISALDGRENAELPASARSFRESLLWEFFQGLFFRKSWTKDFYVTEVAFEGFGSLTTAETQLLDELVRGAFELEPPSKLRSID